MWEWECRYLRFWNLLWQIKISLWSPFILQVLIHCCGYSHLTFGWKWIFQRDFQRAGLIELHIFKLGEYCPILTQYQPSNNQYHTILTPYHQASCSTTLNWRSTTKLESVSPYTDPVPLSTIQYCPMLTQYHYVPFINALYWPSTTDYQHYHLYWPNTTKYQRTPPPPEGLF